MARTVHQRVLSCPFESFAAASTSGKTNIGCFLADRERRKRIQKYYDPTQGYQFRKKLIVARRWASNAAFLPLLPASTQK